MSNKESIFESVLQIPPDATAEQAGAIGLRTLGEVDINSKEVRLRLAEELLQGDISRLDDFRDARSDSTWLENAYKPVGDGTEMPYGNTLVAWPMYADMMREFGRPCGGKGTALMVGAATPMSARSFHVLAEQVYEVERSIIADIRGTKTTQKQGPFVFGDAMQLPFETGSIDIVHTNQLLHMLENTKRQKGRPTNQNIRQFFSEITRILKPGGQLCMVELWPGWSKDVTDENIHMQKSRELAFKIGSMVRNANPDVCRLQTAQIPQFPDYLHDRERTFEPKVGALLGTIVAYARVRPKVTADAPIPLPPAK